MMQRAEDIAASPLELDCRGNQPGIKDSGRRVTAADLEAVGDALASLGLPLAAVHAGYNSLGDAGAHALASLVQIHPVQVLDLTACDVGPSGITALAGALTSCPTFHSLVLDSNPLGDAGGAAVADLINRHSNLQHLSLARCELGEDSLIRISAALEHSPSLQHLDLSEPRLVSRNNESTYHIARALRVNRSLRSLVLRKHPHFTDASVESLCDYLQDNDATLTDLDLSSNKLSGSAGIIIAKTIATGALGLRRLRLSHCRLGNEGALALADALSRGFTLEELDLRHNAIGDRGIAALAEAVCSVPKGAHGEPAAGADSAGGCLGVLRIAGNVMPAGSIAATALGRVLLAGATATALDVRAYEVDGALHIAEES